MRMKEEEGFIIETNLKSLYRLSKGCLRAMMKARKGRISQYRICLLAQPAIRQSTIPPPRPECPDLRSLWRGGGFQRNNGKFRCTLIDTDMTRELTEEQRRDLLAGIHWSPWSG